MPPEAPIPSKQEQRLIEHLRAHFFLIPRDYGKGIVGGALAVLLLTGAVSWSAAKTAVETGAAATATKEIEKLRDRARTATTNIESFGRIVPPGAVVAFDQPSCPKGWSEWREGAGRFILGAGKSTGANHPYRSQGGSEYHALTVAEMPRHSHRLPGTKRNDAATGGGVHVDDVDNGNFPAKLFTAESGVGQPYSTMPPHIALVLCIRR